MFIILFFTGESTESTMAEESARPFVTNETTFECTCDNLGCNSDISRCKTTKRCYASLTIDENGVEQRRKVRTLVGGGV